MGTRETTRIFTKVAWRILPFMMVLAIINYLDRANVAFAALQMNQDLGLTAAAYGFGAGVFFLGYCLFEIPSNLILAKVGVRRWLTRITITWGIIATATAWISSEYSFYIMRFLLGVAEAGFLPAIMYYFRLWLPGQERAKILGIFMSYTAVSNIIGGPLATWLMTTFDGAGGLHGWQVMFLVEGLPSVIIGFFVFYFMAESPEEASWLSTDEKRQIAQALEGEIRSQGARAATALRQGFLDRRVMVLTCLCFFLVIANFGTVFWLPQIIKNFGGLSNVQVGLLSTVPYVLACAAMIAWGYHSDHVGDRKWHLFTSAVTGAVGLVFSAVVANPTASFVGLCVAAVGIWSMFGVFWAMPADFLSGKAAAGGLALINSFGTLGGFVGPYLFGFVRGSTGSFAAGLYVLAGAAVVAGVLALFLRNEQGRAVGPGLVVDSAATR